ncbi:MAG TPA: NlpC/P60 family protein [Streptosporangiaceae bacterium]|nr:NlpC/P60 family protein [Streptosporangiaceae bacterium]
MFKRMFVIMVSVALTSLTLAAGPAVAATRTIRHPLRYLAYQYATTQRGKWYCWGGTGPSCYDCSGLVYAAYRHVHVWFGRSTGAMLSSGRLIRISHAQARQGDLAFFGSGHVELVDRGNITFGAHDPGTRVGWAWSNAYWHPTAYYRVRGTG